MIRKKKGFVDKGLYGLKDKLRKSNDSNEDQKHIEEEQNTPAPLPEVQNSVNKNVDTNDFSKLGNTDTDTHMNETQILQQEKVVQASSLMEKEKEKEKEKVAQASSLMEVEKENEKERVTQASSLIEKDKEKESVQKVKLDKEFTKALQKRKEEYFRTKKHVVDKAESTLNRIPILTLDLRRKLDEITKAEQSIKTTLNEINEIDEKKWTDDYSSDLGIAAKTVENARLQHLMLTNKLTDLDNENNIATTAANGDNSIIPELTSLKFFQLCKMGLGFFLPLIIGLIITASIISATIFFVMGGF